MNPLPPPASRAFTATGLPRSLAGLTRSLAGLPRSLALVAVAFAWATASPAHAQPRSPFEPLSQETPRSQDSPPSLARLDADRGPVAGVRIRQVFPDTQASAAGLRPEEVLVAINGETLISHDQFAAMRGLNGGADDVFTFQDSSGQRRDLRFREGRIGIRSATAPSRLTLAVSRAMVRDPAWNDALLAAAWALEQDRADDADRWLKAAREAGCPDDEVFRSLDFRVASARGEFARAAERLQTLPSPQDHQKQRHLPGPLERYPHFLASGDTPQLLALIEDPSGVFSLRRNPRWPSLEARLRAGGPQPKPVATRATDSTGAVRAVNPMLFGAANGASGGDFHSHNELIIDGEPFVMSAAPGNFDQALLTRNQAFGDFDLHARFSIRQNGTPDPEYASGMRVNVYDGEAGPGGPEDLLDSAADVLGASFWVSDDSPGDQYFHLGWDQSAPMDPSFFDGKTEHHLHLSRRGNRGILRLNGRQLVNLPVRTAERLVFRLHLVGMEAAFSAFEITEPWEAR